MPHFKEVAKKLFAILCLILFIFLIEKVGKEERSNVRKTVNLKYFLQLSMFSPKFWADQPMSYTKFARNHLSYLISSVSSCAQT